MVNNMIDFNKELVVWNDRLYYIDNNPGRTLFAREKDISLLPVKSEISIPIKYIVSKEEIQYKVKVLNTKKDIDEIYSLNISDKIIMFNDFCQILEIKSNWVLYPSASSLDYLEFIFFDNKDTKIYTLTGSDIKSYENIGLLVSYDEPKPIDRTGQVYNPYNETWSWGFC